MGPNAGFHTGNPLLDTPIDSNWDAGLAVLAPSAIYGDLKPRLLHSLAADRPAQNSSDQRIRSPETRGRAQAL